METKDSRAEMSAQHSPWFKHWFNSSFYHQLYGHRDEKEAAGFIDALLAKLQLRKNARIMDLGCGAGRHAKYLASKGFDVTGTDLAIQSIRNAKKYETSGLHFYRHDMRQPFGSGKFDLVCNFFTSFGYFSSEEENHRVMQNISKALRPDGIAVIDYLNVSYSEAHLIPEEKKEIDGIRYHLTRWTDEKHFFKQIRIDAGLSNQPFLFCEQVAKLYRHDFESLFACNGLSLQYAYGDYSLNEYESHASPRLILIAKK